MHATMKPLARYDFMHLQDWLKNLAVIGFQGNVACDDFWNSAVHLMNNERRLYKIKS